MGNIKVTETGDDTFELGVVAGSAESYDPASGQIFRTITINKKELDAAFKQASTDRKARDKATKDSKVEGFEPRFAPWDVRADSSPLSQDRPPIYISSDSNPSEANPQPNEGEPVADVPRRADGLAAVEGNQNLTEAPSGDANRNDDPPAGVEAPTPKKNVRHEDTALGQREARDAEAARNGGGSTGSANLEAAAARAVKRAADSTPAPAPAATKAKASTAKK